VALPCTHCGPPGSPQWLCHALTVDVQVPQNYMSYARTLADRLQDERSHALKAAHRQRQVLGALRVVHELEALPPRHHARVDEVQVPYRSHMQSWPHARRHPPFEHGTRCTGHMRGRKQAAETGTPACLPGAECLMPCCTALVHWRAATLKKMCICPRGRQSSSRPIGTAYVVRSSAKHMCG